MLRYPPAHRFHPVDEPRLEVRLPRPALDREKGRGKEVWLLSFSEPYTSRPPLCFVRRKALCPLK